MSISRLLLLIVAGIYVLIFFLLQEVEPIGDFLWVVQVSHVRWFFLPLIFGVILIWFYDKPEDDDQKAMLVGGLDTFSVTFYDVYCFNYCGQMFF